MKELGILSNCNFVLAVLILIILTASVFGRDAGAENIQRGVVPCFASHTRSDSKKVYDLIVIGAGASGMFAAGTASMFGSKTLVLEEFSQLGGDCTNAACVPSKAVRSIANMAAASGVNNQANVEVRWLDMAQQHAYDTVGAVSQRENLQDVSVRNPNLSVQFVKSCRFVSRHEIEFVPSQHDTNSTTTSDTDVSGIIIVSGKKFLIATGASPIFPQNLADQAEVAGVPLFTYRTILNPRHYVTDSTANAPSIWELLQHQSETRKNVVIAGGGPTACELGQALARLVKAENANVDVSIVAPTILPREDVALRYAAMKLLVHDGIRLVLGHRVTEIIPNQSKTKSSDFVYNTCSALGSNQQGGEQFQIHDVIALVLCVGRSPESSLARLDLGAANVKWTTRDGVLVDKYTLSSPSARHVYACGDCCSVTQDNRSAAHAGWTGFHAARNTIAPSWLLFPRLLGRRIDKPSIHEHVPRVTFTHPELASVGMSHADCVRQYGMNGFDCLHIAEEDTMDRADMERLERFTSPSFIELRATKHGKVLGMTCCSPVGSELANELGLVLEHGLSVTDVARAMHAYPSHGYMLHRMALALATKNTLGLLESAGGPFGKVVAKLSKGFLRATSSVKILFSPQKRLKMKRLKNWEADGAGKEVMLWSNNSDKHVLDVSSIQDVKLMNFLQLSQNETLVNNVSHSSAVPKTLSAEKQLEFLNWIESR